VPIDMAKDFLGGLDDVEEAENEKLLGSAG
jgi:hypothetical protein